MGSHPSRLMRSPARGHKQSAASAYGKSAQKKEAPRSGISSHLSEAPKFCPTRAVQVGFHVPPKVNGRRPGTGFDLPMKA